MTVMAVADRVLLAVNIVLVCVGTLNIAVRGFR